MASVIYLLGILFVSSSAQNLLGKELKLLHVLSANKFYVPDYNPLSGSFEAPKHLTYNYFLKNAADVPNTVKMDLFNLGVYLRNRYDMFLGSLYLDEITKMQTTEFSVSIIAGELINAGLWPPVPPQVWKEDLLWQPVPFVYTSSKEDALLLGTLCPTFEHETLHVLKNYNLSAEHRELLNQINEEGQLELKNPIDSALFYLAVENSNELNQTRPEWLNKVFQNENLFNVSLLAYDLLSTTRTQKQLNGGSFLKAVIQNSKDYIKGTLNKERKINIYSGDERNLAGVLKNLDIHLAEFPAPGAAVIFELYSEANAHFVKVLYYTGRSNEPIPFILSGCELLCPLEKFSELVADFLPENELSLCGSMVEKPTEKPKGGASSTAFSLFTSLPLIIFCAIRSISF